MKSAMTVGWRRRVVALGTLLMMAVTSIAAELPGVVLRDEGVHLTDWMVVGPWNCPQGAVALDAGIAVGLDPAQASIGLESFAASLSSVAPGVRRRVAASVEFLDLGECLGLMPSAGTPDSIAYAVCRIEAERDREAWLLFGSDARVSIWLNGLKRHVVAKPRSLKQYDDAIALPLRRGTNLLLVSAVNCDRYWTITARLEPTQDAAIRSAFESSDGFFARAVVERGELLRLAVRALPETACWSGTIETWDRRPIRDVRVGSAFPLSTGDLPEGLYRLLQPGGGRWSETAFYVGTISTLHRRFIDRCAARTMDDSTRITLDGLLRRLEILSSASRPESRAANDVESSRRAPEDDVEYKAVYAASEIEAILASRVLDGGALRDRPGLHLRGLRSAIDGQPVYYRIFVPSSYRRDGPGMPLFIMPQPVTSANRPFLESTFVARHREAESWAQAAEKLGVAILWPGYRVRPYGNPIDFAHLDEVFARISSDYHVDRHRIYLHGYCSTGLFSAMEAVRHPDRYAAVAMVNPVLHRLKGRYDEREEFRMHPAYRRWLHDTDPVEPFSSISAMPLWVVHDDVDPDHGPLAHTVELVERRRAQGGEVRFDRHDEPLPGPMRFRQMTEQLAWLTRQRRDREPPEGQSTRNRISVSDALAEPFVVVRGTQGSEFERRLSAGWTEQFVDAWQRMTFVPCRVVDDRELGSTDEHTSNLVLIGNERTNLIWARLRSQLPVRLSDEAVWIGNREYRGQGLAIQATTRHPEHADRNVVLVGSAGAATTPFGTLELAIDGWFSYAVWSSAGGSPTLRDASRQPVTTVDLD